ncbi:MAG: plasmid pRiA4b ORF-3 family protein [Verrucomicrobia bacterium]|nr:MAG: plasmid pRiA4b ORF-3 family protein [Verrucomicrobiota bacterium]
MDQVLQFRVELLGVSPPVWRLIQVPASYTLWDLHVAIQDSMGWKDQHLHAFRIVGSATTFGIPDEEDDDPFQTIPGWETKVQDVFSFRDQVGTYEYDFGDSWIHLILFEGYEPSKQGESFPRCLGGARRCPPEDCGGPEQYAELLVGMRDSTHPEHESIIDWLGGDIDPEEFNSELVRFDDPKARWGYSNRGLKR